MKCLVKISRRTTCPFPSSASAFESFQAASNFRESIPACCRYDRASKIRKTFREAEDRLYSGQDARRQEFATRETSVRLYSMRRVSRRFPSRRFPPLVLRDCRKQGCFEKFSREENLHFFNFIGEKRERNLVAVEGRGRVLNFVNRHR